ncbi:hypothetical protein [Nocardioides gilvus]|uniref:hypothetical protein n=1 Tax=Nocardioides gilvus TaxID=1735589 RepID=UPI000D746B4C|nr:hypothetical protein [Nocardioides gilvus]
MDVALPQVCAVAWWSTAWLQGHVVTDDLLDALAELGSLHLFRAASATNKDLTDCEGQTALPFLAALRRRGATHVSITLPVDGDPLGLGGPAAFNADALMAGQGLVATQVGVGAVPHEGSDAVTWLVHSTARRSVPDVGEADRGLRQTMLRATDSLAELDVGAWSPTTADELMDLRRVPRLPGVPGIDPAHLALAARAAQAWRIVEVALRDHGGALSATEVARRQEVLSGLERAARRALVAACSPDVWPSA